MTAFQYAVLRYMPDTARQETVNVGVAVAIPGTAAAVVRTLKKAHSNRLKWLGVADDISFLDDVADDLAHPPLMAADALVRARAEWGGTIRVSELHTALHENPQRLCEELYDQYVANPRERRTSEYRDRRLVRRRVTSALQRGLLKEAVKKTPSVQGQHEQHKFDIGLGDGRLLHAVATLSFDAPVSNAFQREIDAWAWAITDVHAIDKGLPISIVTIGANSRLDKAASMYEALGARLIREPNIDDWARGVTSELVTRFPQLTAVGSASSPAS